MRKLPESTIKKALIGLALFSVFAIAPHSLAEDLLSPLIGTVSAPPEVLADTSTPIDVPAPTPSPFATPVATSSSEPVPIVPAPTDQAPQVQLLDSATPILSPPPLPPQALDDQLFHVAVPSRISVDPRAHAIFLPPLQISGVDILLVCGYSNATNIFFMNNMHGVESTAAGAPIFRIAGQTQLVMAALNANLGTQVISASKALTGSVLSFTFVAISRPSINAALCNQGSPSNNRTITFHALNIDLNMVKDTVRLK